MKCAQKSVQITHVIYLFLSLLLFSCSTENVNSSSKPTTTFSYNCMGVFEQVLLTGDRSEIKSCRGEMYIYSHLDNTTTKVNWYGTLNKKSKTISSDISVEQATGVYDYTLVIYDGNHRYVGSSRNVNPSENEQVNISVLPTYKIGESTTTFDLNNLPKIQFIYTAENLINIDDPKIGIIIDGGNENCSSPDFV